MSDTLRRASEITSDAMNDILACFKPGAKITVLVRHPGFPDGTRDFVMTNDEFPAAIAALQIRQQRGHEGPAS